jgi:hypothetical protein
MSRFKNHITPELIEGRKSALIERGKAHRVLQAVACERRLGRAVGLDVTKARESAATGALWASVASESNEGISYVVEMDAPRDGRIRSFSCSCRDHRDRGVVCKHMLAVSLRFCDQKLIEYKLLTDVEKMFGF